MSVIKLGWIWVYLDYFIPNLVEPGDRVQTALEVLIPPSIYYGCSTQKNFREEKFIGGENLFSAVNMKSFGRRNVRKHREIKGSDKYVTLDISLKFDSLENMKIKSSGQKKNLED